MTGKTDKHPPLWIFHRRPIFLIYRVYYQGMGINPEIVETKAPREVELPKEKPDDLVAYVFGMWSPMNGNVVDRMVLDSENEIDVQKNFVGDVVVEDVDGALAEEKMPVTRNQHVNHKLRLQHLMELKLRLDLLNEHGGFTENEKKVEKTKLYEVLPKLIPANAIKNRHLFMMETKLRMEILKDLKHSGVRPDKCSKLMKDMYLGLPPLVSMEDMESSFVAEKKGKRFANRMAKKAARVAKPGEKKQAMQSRLRRPDIIDAKAANADVSQTVNEAEAEWEVLDQVNASVESMNVAA